MKLRQNWLGKILAIKFLMNSQKLIVILSIYFRKPGNTAGLIQLDQLKQNRLRNLLLDSINKNETVNFWE